MIKYDKLFALLEAEGITSYKIFKNKVMSQSTFYDLRANRPVSTKSLDRICALLQCQPGDIIKWALDEDEPTFGETDSGKGK